jgi:hypothetical protein
MNQALNSLKFCDRKVDLISTIFDFIRQSDSCMMSGQACMLQRKSVNPAMGNDSKWKCLFHPHYNQ